MNLAHNDRLGTFLEGIYQGTKNKDELETMSLDDFLGQLSKSFIGMGCNLDKLVKNEIGKDEEKPFVITVLPDTNPLNKKIHVSQVDRDGNKVEDKFYTKQDIKTIRKNNYEAYNSQRMELAYKYGMFLSSDYFSDIFEEAYHESKYEDWHDFCKEWITEQHESNMTICIADNEQGYTKSLYIMKDDAFDNDWISDENDCDDDGLAAILKCIFDLEKKNYEIETKYDDLSFQLGEVFHKVKDGLMLSNADELYESGIKLSSQEY